MKALVRDAVRLMRIKQWIKNFFVFAPLVFSLNLFDAACAARSCLVFAAFCLVSSGVYVFNDIADRERDRLHPDKKHRPVASGRVQVKAALPLGIFLAAAGTALAGFLSPVVLIILCGYLAVNILYSLLLRRQTFIDVMVIAIGFLLRVGAGAAAIGVQLSQWMLLTTFFLSLFLGFGKRREEALVVERAEEHRGVFRDYSVELLNYLIAISAALTIITYSLYVITSETMHELGSNLFFITIPFVVFGVFRYMLLIFQNNLGGDPADLVLKDRPMIVAVTLWALSVLTLLGITLLSGGQR